ncbi:nuclear transport factor 2 family protein [Microtetraspora niveoalba]|uniref:nuclear transport factor 2 family protein n=1 Tax=Microtetraspora niveoalba TaxID=46175 RepID=UPI00082AB496|nr:nuclear transport factor 2 family protein [Microtetraspora niveoalba]
MTEARELLNRHTAAFNDHDIEALLRVVSPGAVWISPEGPAEGHEEIASHIGQFFTAFPDVRAVVWETIDHGDLAAEELMMVGTHGGTYLMPGGRAVPGTGRPIQLRCCSMCTVEDGLIVSLRFYFDQLELLAQLGLLPDSQV